MGQPKIKLSFEPYDKFLLGVSLITVMGMILLPLLNYGSLPEKIPIHFDAKGTPDRYGNKAEIWIIPAIGITLIGFLWGISRIPHTFNYAVKITSDNATYHYRYSVKLMRTLAAIIGMGLTIIVWEIIRNVSGKQIGLNPFFLPIFLGCVFFAIGYFLNKSFRLENK